MSKKLEKVCFIYTGGTIAMVKDETGIQRPPEDPHTFTNVVPQIRDIAEVRFVPVVNKDSINMTPSDWMKIADAIHKEYKDGYERFVVAHGVDTMAFSASAVSFAFGSNLNFPVVFTGGQTGAHEYHGDGLSNLLHSFQIALTDIAEVVICFNDKVFRATRAQKKDDRKFDAFESPACPPVAFLKNEIEIQSFAKRRDSNAHSDYFNNTFIEGILPIPLAPSLIPEILFPAIESPLCKGVILESYGGENVPWKEKFSFIELIQHSISLGKPVIVASQFPADSTRYTLWEGGIKAKEAGAIPISGMVLSTLIVKLSWILGRLSSVNFKNFDSKKEQIENWLEHNYVGEAGNNLIIKKINDDNK